MSGVVEADRQSLHVNTSIQPHPARRLADLNIVEKTKGDGSCKIKKGPIQLLLLIAMETI